MRQYDLLVKRLVVTLVALGLVVADGAAQQHISVVGNQQHTSFVGKWIPVEASSALRPSGATPADVIGAMGGSITITQDAKTFAIDNGVLKLVCAFDPTFSPRRSLGGGPATPRLTAVLTVARERPAAPSNTLSGWAEWIAFDTTLMASVHAGSRDRLTMGPVLRLVYYIDGTLEHPVITSWLSERSRNRADLRSRCPRSCIRGPARAESDHPQLPHHEDPPIRDVAEAEVQRLARASVLD